MTFVCACKFSMVLRCSKYILIYIGWSNSGMTKLPGRGFSRNPEQTTPSWNRNMHRQFTSTVIQSFLRQSWLWDQWWHRLSNLSNFPLATRNRRPSETYWNSLWACSNPLGQEYTWSIWISHWILLIFIEASGAAMAGKATCSFLGKTSWWSCEARKPRDPLADRSWDWRDPFRWVDRGSRPTSQGPWAFMDEEWINEFKMIVIHYHPLSYGYGSIPINTIFSGLFTSINPSYLDVNKKGVLLVLTHCHMSAICCHPIISNPQYQSTISISSFAQVRCGGARMLLGSLAAPDRAASHAEGCLAPRRQGHRCQAPGAVMLQRVTKAVR